MARGVVWGIDGSHFTADILAAFASLGFETKLVTRAQADQAGTGPPPPDFVLDIKFHTRTLQLLSQRNIPFVGVSLDHWYDSARPYPRNPRLPGHVYAFTCDPNQIHAFQAMGFHHVEYLPFGVNEEIFKPIEMSEEERHRIGGDVCFVGTSLLNNPIDGHDVLKRDLSTRAESAPPKEAEACRRMMTLLDELVAIQSQNLFTYQVPQLLQDLESKHRITFLSDGMTRAKETWTIRFGIHIAMKQRIEVVRRLAQDAGIVVYGSEDWKMLGVPGLTYRGFAPHGTLLPRVINASAIHINVSKPMFDTGIGPRIFETLACGAFLLTNRLTAITSLFVDGKDLVIYDTLDDLVEKTRYYLAHPVERRAIAERGMRKVRAQHTFLHRARRILDVLEEDGIVPPASGSTEKA